MLNLKFPNCKINLIQKSNWNMQLILKCIPSLLMLTILGLCFSCMRTSEKEASESEGNLETTTMNDNFDWQGHRGARGLLPENTIPAFLKALEYPIQTLELDVAISKDGKVVISHEPWMSPTICFRSDGDGIPEEEEQAYKIYGLDYESIAQFNCGKKHEGFPEQQSVAVAKPLLSAMIDSVERYCETNNRSKPFYNIEIKSEISFSDYLS